MCVLCSAAGDSGDVALLLCAECGVAAVALLLLARCCVGLQKSITLSEPIPAQQPGAGSSKQMTV